MRILVTGGAGFLGFHLATDLIQEGHEVVLVDNMVRGRKDEDFTRLITSSRVSFVRADLEDPSSFNGIRSHFDEVYHLAAVIGVRHVMNDPGLVLRVNARTLLNILELFIEQECGRLFFASTSEVYAWTSKLMKVPVPTPESVPLTVDAIANRRASYALSKIFGEMTLTQTLSETDDRLIVGRFHNVYGPRMGTAHVIPELYLRMRSGKRPIQVRESAATRAFCYVDDAVRACRHLMSKAPDGIYNIGNDAEEITIRDLALALAEQSGLNEKDLQFEIEEPPVIPRRCPDITKLRTTGFAPEVRLAEGIRLTLDWYRDREIPTGL